MGLIDTLKNGPPAAFLQLPATPQKERQLTLQPMRSRHTSLIWKGRAGAAARQAHVDSAHRAPECMLALE